MGVLLDLLEHAERFEIFNYLYARFLSVKPNISSTCGSGHLAVISDNGLKGEPVLNASYIVVWIMCWGELYNPTSKLWIHKRVGDNRNLAVLNGK